MTNSKDIANKRGYCRIKVFLFDVVLDKAVADVIMVKKVFYGNYDNIDREAVQANILNIIFFY